VSNDARRHSRNERIDEVAGQAIHPAFLGQAVAVNERDQLCVDVCDRGVARGCRSAARIAPNQMGLIVAADLRDGLAVA
jgi:hypothetical protein